jgi:hypothetical protein
LNYTCRGYGVNHIKLKGSKAQKLKGTKAQKLKGSKAQKLKGSKALTDNAGQI